MNTSFAGTPPTRFYALDAIRGLAALAVVLYHYTQHNGLHWLHGAWVAVDIFFMLSGFVLMHSYSKKVAQGMTVKAFLYSRLARLGPMYLVGISLGILAALYSIYSASQNLIHPDNLIKAALLNLALLPYFNSQAWPFGASTIYGTVFPLNDPAWSLFFEFFVNIIFFVYLTRFRQINLALWVAIAGLIFVGITLYFHQINPGSRGNNFVFGFPRVIFEFFLGVLIYKFYNLYPPTKKIAAWLIFALVTLCMFSSLGAIALGNALLLAPFLIILFSKLAISEDQTGICKFLGDISYPLYVTHFPLYRLLYEFDFINHLSPVTQTMILTTIAICLAIVLVKIDESVRSTVKKRRLSNLQTT